MNRWQEHVETLVTLRTIRSDLAVHLRFLQNTRTFVMAGFIAGTWALLSAYRTLLVTITKDGAVSGGVESYDPHIFIAISMLGIASAAAAWLIELVIAQSMIDTNLQGHAIDQFLQYGDGIFTHELRGAFRMDTIQGLLIVVITLSFVAWLYLFGLAVVVEIRYLR